MKNFKKWVPLALSIFTFASLGVAQVIVRGAGPGSVPAGAGQSGYLNSVGGNLVVDAGIVITGGNGVTATGTFTSTTASGNNGFACSTDGCRMDLGTGPSDYLSSDGTRVQATDRFGAIAIEVPTTTGNVYFDGTSRTIGINYNGTILRVLGTAALAPATDQAINFGNTTTRWSNGYFGQLNVIQGTHATAMGVVHMVTNITTTSVSSATAGPNDLITYSLPAASLAGTPGRGVRITAWGTTTNNANAKTVTCNFGGTAIITTALTISQAGTWRVVGEVMRTGATTQISTATLVQGGTTTLVDTETGAPGETLANAVTIKCTGTNEITQLGLIVEEFN